MNCSSGLLETSTWTSWGCNTWTQLTSVIEVLEAALPYLVTEDANSGVQSEAVTILQSTVGTRHAPPAWLLLGVSQNVRFEIGGLGELLVAALNTNIQEINTILPRIWACLLAYLKRTNVRPVSSVYSYVSS